MNSMASPQQAMESFSHEFFTDLRILIARLRVNPSLVHADSLDFFKAYLISLGCILPSASSLSSTALLRDAFGGITKDSSSSSSASSSSSSSDANSDDSGGESSSRMEKKQSLSLSRETQKTGHKAVTLDAWGRDVNAAVVLAQEAKLPPPAMGDESIEPTKEQKEQATKLKAHAQQLLQNNDVDEAVHALTDAIVLDGTTASLYAARADALIRAGRPSAAERDANAAVALNRDYGRAYRERGRARLALTRYDEAASDLRQACALDWDEVAAEALRRAEVHARRTTHASSRRARKEAKERDKVALRQRREAEQAAALRRAEAVAVYEAKKAEEARNRNKAPAPSPAPGMLPGMGLGTRDGVDDELNAVLARRGMAARSFASDPEIVDAMADAELKAKLLSCLEDPRQLVRHQRDKKLLGLLERVLTRQQQR